MSARRVKAMALQSLATILGDSDALIRNALEYLAIAELREQSDVAQSNVRHLLQRTGRKSFRFADIEVRLVPQGGPFLCRCCNDRVEVCANAAKAVEAGGFVPVYRCERDLPDYLYIRRVDRRLSKHEGAA